MVPGELSALLSLQSRWLLSVRFIYEIAPFFFPASGKFYKKNNYQFYFKAWCKKPTQLEQNERELLQLKANIPQKRENN